MNVLNRLWLWWHATVLNSVMLFDPDSHLPGNKKQILPMQEDIFFERLFTDSSITNPTVLSPRVQLPINESFPASHTPRSNQKITTDWLPEGRENPSLEALLVRSRPRSNYTCSCAGKNYMQTTIEVSIHTPYGVSTPSEDHDLLHTHPQLLTCVTHFYITTPWYLTSWKWVKFESSTLINNNY